MKNFATTKPRSAEGVHTIDLVKNNKIYKRKKAVLLCPVDFMIQDKIVLSFSG